MDDAGFTLRLEKPAGRIIALYGAYNELLLALGCGESIAARTTADADIPELAGKPVIGTHMRPNQELIVAQKPDCVLQLSGRGEAALQADALRALGIPVLSFALNSFEDMFSVTERLGRLTGREARAGELAREWRATLAAVASRHAGRPRLRLFCEARYPNLLAAGSASIVHEIMAVAGGENIVTEKKKLVRFSEEALIAADPDAYIIQKGPMNPAPQPLAQRAHYRNLHAARSGRVLIVDETAFARPGPRAVRAADELERWLHQRKD